MNETMPSTEERKPRHSVPVWVQVIVWGLLLALLAVMAIGLRRSQQGHIQVGDELPADMTMTFFDGYGYEGRSQISFGELRGRVVLINVWASWCVSCKEEAPWLESVWREFEPRGDVVFIGLDYVDIEPDARAWMQRYDNTYPNGPDLGTRISQYFRVSGVPETYVFDRDGILRYVKIGPFTSAQEIRSAVLQVLGE